MLHAQVSQYKILLAGIMCIWMLSCTNPPDKEASTPLRNAVIFSVETMRADHLGCYGYERPTSASIDAFASEGSLFTNAFVPRGITWPSLVSVMTSLYPVQHGVRTNGLMIKEEHVQLAEVFQQQGYRTAAFVSNVYQVNWRGFDTIFHSYDDAELVQEAITWIERGDDRPYFIWVHLFAPHWNYTPPAPYDTLFYPDYTGPIDGSNETYVRQGRTHGQLPPEDVEQMVALYDGEIAHASDQFHIFHSYLDQAGDRDSTVVVFMSDHGEELHDRHEYFDHFASAYQNVKRVPLIIRAPKHIPAGQQIDRIVDTLDIAPTVLALLNIPIPGQFEGIPFDFQMNSKNNPKGYVISEWENRILMIRTSDYTYVYNPTGFHTPARRFGLSVPYIIDNEELYDRNADPRERNNIISENREIADDLRSQLLAWATRYGWKETTDPYKPEELPAHITEELRALGYLD